MATFSFYNVDGTFGSSYFTLETATTSAFYPPETPAYMEGVWATTDVAFYPTANLDISIPSASYALNGSGSLSINTVNFIFTGSSTVYTNDTIYLDVSTFVDTTVVGFANELYNVYNSIYNTVPPYDTFLSFIAIGGLVDSFLSFYYFGNNISYGNTIPYTLENISGQFSGGERMDLGLVTSSYVAGTIINPTTGYDPYFTFIPNNFIPIGALLFRGTGNYEVVIGTDLTEMSYNATQLTGSFYNPFWIPSHEGVFSAGAKVFTYSKTVTSTWSNAISASSSDTATFGYDTYVDNNPIKNVRSMASFKGVVGPNGKPIQGAALYLSISVPKGQPSFKIKIFKGTNFNEPAGVVGEYSSYRTPGKGDNREYSDEITITPDGGEKIFIYLNQNAVDDLAELNEFNAMAIIGEYDYNGVDPLEGYEFTIVDVVLYTA